MSASNPNPIAIARKRELFEAIGIKGELAKTARRYLRNTSEYADAKSCGVAREWLDSESSSLAESMYELLGRDLEQP